MITVTAEQICVKDPQGRVLRWPYKVSIMEGQESIKVYLAANRPLELQEFSGIRFKTTAGASITIRADIIKIIPIKEA